MMTLRTTCAACLVALACASAHAVELNVDERSELRERAEYLQSERQRNPGWDGGVRRTADARGDVDLNQNRGDVKLNQNRGEVKPKARSESTRKREPAKSRTKRSLKNIPGALVRER